MDDDEETNHDTLEQNIVLPNKTEQKVRSSSRLAAHKLRVEQQEQLRRVQQQQVYNSDNNNNHTTTPLDMTYHRPKSGRGNKHVPWGHICGYPITHRSGGDLYGGAMYLQSAAQTLQGHAIREASIRFGDGRTLPFPPCKQGYIPLVGSQRRYACPYHHRKRELRVRREGGKFRMGEFDLNIFWNKDLEVPEKDSKP